MPLQTAAPYPVSADASQGWAVINVRSPHSRTFELVNEELVASAREHAGEWERFADQLSALLDAGWSLQGGGALYATRAATAAELPALLDEVARRGAVAEWCVSDDRGGLFAVGGLASGAPTPEATFPGSPLPALVANDLTGAQRVVESESELQSVVAEELAACAEWWRAHPQELSDHAAHGLVGDLQGLADEVHAGPVPAWVNEEANMRRLFSEAPSTRVAVYPVSAVVFTGVMEATRSYSSMTLAPREGLGETLIARGRALAAELGVATD